MKIFDKAASNWDKNTERMRLQTVLAQAIKNNVPLSKCMRALDFGCGTGIMSFMLAESVGSIDAVDVSAGMIDELDLKLKQPGAPENITGHRLVLTRDTLGKEQFELLFTVLTMHHVKDTPALIETFAHKVKTGGYVALIDLDEEDGSFHYDKTEVHHFGFRREYIRALLEANGFEDFKDYDAASRKREQPDGSFRSYPLFLITARKSSQ
ncbi:MAG: class I SAM-dependent methyltransferase [Lentisphaerae bacterium]|nr:class I SAM-dependent methyltransferase [Lentisphaerota bacterium]MCP4100000.1 class I SAM-dependent methyltransferase [Lentisphaerota bacterium]